MAADEVLAAADLTEKCMTLFALNAKKNAKCRLNHQKTDQFIAESVFRRNEKKKDSKLIV